MKDNDPPATGYRRIMLPTAFDFTGLPPGSCEVLHQMEDPPVRPCVDDVLPRAPSPEFELRYFSTQGSYDPGDWDMMFELQAPPTVCIYLSHDDLPLLSHQPEGWVFFDEGPVFLVRFHYPYPAPEAPPRTNARAYRRSRADVTLKKARARLHRACHSKNPNQETPRWTKLARRMSSRVSRTHRGRAS